MYKRSEYLESTDCRRQCLAMNNAGLDWNYAIAPKIDRDLHERLLAVTAEQALPFAEILPLIASGYFDTARGIVDAWTTEDPTLSGIKEWLVGALSEADECPKS